MSVLEYVEKKIIFCCPVMCGLGEKVLQQFPPGHVTYMVLDILYACVGICSIHTDKIHNDG